MTRPTRMEINCETGATLIIELTDEEIANINAIAAEEEAAQVIREAEIQAKAEAKASAQAKLAALGLTPEEIAALG